MDRREKMDKGVNSGEYLNVVTAYAERGKVLLYCIIG